MKRFTREQLEQNNGQAGRPAYVALEGRVYDVSGSPLWKEGLHQGMHKAGANLSDRISAAPHGAEVFERMKQVGVLVEETPGSVSATPEWARPMLALHPHPISIHFPQAFFTFAPLFLAAHYLFDNPHFERCALYLLICGAATGLPAILTGLFHWMFKYGKNSGLLFRLKMVFSLTLFSLAIVTLLIHIQLGSVPREPANLLLLSLYLLHLPLAMVTGHLGGKISFGS